MDRVIKKQIIPGVEKKRLLSIDRARGFCMIFLMVFIFVPVEYMGSVARFLFSHSQIMDRSITFDDIGFFGFLYCFGMLFTYSFYFRRKTDGIAKLTKHFLFRFIVLLFAGLVLTVIGNKLISLRQIFLTLTFQGQQPYWNVLFCFAIIGILAFPFLFVKANKRFASALGLIFLYQLFFIFTPYKHELLYASFMGTFKVIIAGVFVVLCASYFAELLFLKSGPYNNRLARYLLWAIFFSAFGFFLGFFQQFHISRLETTPTFIMCVTGLAMMVFFFFIIFADYYKRDIIILDSFGKNPLILYVVAYVLHSILTAYLHAVMAPLIILSCLLFMTVLAIFLDKKKIFIKI